MTTRTHNYKNAYTEEKIDDNGNVLSYKQWNDDVLIIHREWKYDSNNRKIQFLDLFTNYISNSSYHKLGNITIKNSWDSDGRNSKFYSEYISPFKYRIKFNDGEREEKEITFNV